MSHLPTATFVLKLVERCHIVCVVVVFVVVPEGAPEGPETVVLMGSKPVTEFVCGTFSYSTLVLFLGSLFGLVYTS